MKVFTVLFIALSMQAVAQEPSVEKKSLGSVLLEPLAPEKSTVENAEFSAWKDKLFQDTGLRSGFYKLIKGPKTCQFGELEIKNVGSTASLMFSDHAVLIQMPWGAHPLAKSEEDEDGCARSYQYRYSKGLIHGVQTLTCKDQVREEHYDMDLKVDGNSLILSVHDHDDPKIKGRVCQLKRAPGRH